MQVYKLAQNPNRIIFEKLTESCLLFITIEPSGRRTRRALEKGEKYCPLSKIEVKKKL